MGSFRWDPVAKYRKSNIECWFLFDSRPNDFDDVVRNLTTDHDDGHLNAQFEEASRWVARIRPDDVEVVIHRATFTWVAVEASL